MRLTVEERLTMLRRRRRSQPARVAVQVLTWVASGLGLALLVVLIGTGH